jgi:hypothetical protein
MPNARRASVSGFLAAMLAAAVGIIAFNVVDGVFGAVEAKVGLVACIVVTVFVFRRSPPGKEEPDA